MTAATIVFALNTLFLLIVGTGMSAAPAKFFPTADALGHAMTRGLGIGDLGMAAITIVALVTKTSPGTAALTGLAVFHLGLTVMQAVSTKTAFYKLPVLITHGAFGAAFVWLVMSAG